MVRIGFRTCRSCIYIIGWENTGECNRIYGKKQFICRVPVISSISSSALVLLKENNLRGKKIRVALKVPAEELDQISNRV